jgi:PhzF family phenazine biosynthesis protein
MTNTMGQRITLVDAFTSKPFAGNPAAVCILPEPGDAKWMQDVAREMNMSETAFLVRSRFPGSRNAGQSDGYDLRWFTPVVEVELCGHATLASAHVLWEEGHLRSEQQARFHTLSGLLTAERKGDWIEMDFPATPEQPTQSPPGLADMLGASPRYVGKNQFDYFVELDSEDVVKNLRPNFSMIEKLPVRGVIVTAKSSSGECDFVSRFFGPQSGVAEDPVTGSSHCCLGPYWGKKLNKTELVGYQASARGGVVRVRLGGNRVYLQGQAVTVLRGELL